MNAEKLFVSLSDREKLAVINLALPGIDVYLQETLSREGLSEEGEKLRRKYVGMLTSGSPPDKLSEQNGYKEGSEEEDTEVSKTFTHLRNQPISDDRDDETAVNRTSGLYDLPACSDTKLHTVEKSGDSPPLCRRDTDSTLESGICSRLSHSDWETDGSTPRNLLTVDSTSRDTILSDNSEFEVPDWENESVGNLEEGYCTGDNALSDNGVEHYNIKPNELGEIYSGTMYIREPPGWHKRWFVLKEQCLKCYRHRTENKMLFEIPLKRARYIATDKKRSRMFPLSLSVPILKEAITFATTEDRSRQQWIYVLSFVISELAKRHSPPSSPEPEVVEQRKISLTTLLQGDSLDSQTGKDANESLVDDETKMIQRFTQYMERNEAERRRKCSSDQEVDHGRTLSETDGSVDEVAGSMAQWSLSLQGEDEMAELDSSLSPRLADDEAFKELQECLPDILHRPRRFTGGSRKNRPAITKAQSYSEVHVQNTGIDDKPRTTSQTSDVSSGDEFAKAFSTPDLRCPPRVKRHGSLTAVLSNKASRVKSKLTTSFFKKGKKGDAKHYKDLATQSTTFSGYLLRRKGSVWKNRWCVVKEHNFFCYKDFGVGISELEFHLEGCSLHCVPESEAEKPFVFTIGVQNEEIFLAAENDAELEEWIMVLEVETSGNPEPPSSPDFDSQTSMSSPTVTAPPGFADLEPLNHDQQKDTSETSCSASYHSSSPPQTTKSKHKTSAQGKKSLFSSLTHKFGHKSKAKAIPSPGESKRQQPVGNSVEDGFVMVSHEVVPRHQDSLGVRKGGDEVAIHSAESLGTPVAKEGYLHQRLNEEVWLKCWVKLENHYLHIHDDKECEDAVVVKIRLSNCVVLDCTGEARPWVLEIRRTIGQALFLQADSEAEYKEWKQSISKSVVSSPFPPRRPPPSSDRPLSPEESGKHNSREKDAEVEEVFHKEDKEPCVSAHRVATPSPPLNPSPRPSTAGDISSGGSDDETRARSQRLKDAADSDRLRTESEVDKKSEAPRKYRKVRRAITNAFSSKKSAEHPTRKRRSRTVCGVNVALSLLTNVKHSSCLYVKNSSGVWAKRWCVLQDGSLHFFKYADDQKPSLSLCINQECEVRRIMKRSRRFTFDLTLPNEHTEYCFAADNENEMYRWMDVLRNASADSRKLKKKLVGERTFDLVKSSGESLPARNQKPDITRDLHDTLDVALESQIRTSSSMDDLRLDRINREDVVKEEKLNKSSDDVSSAYRGRLTSLDDVLKLLQDQKLLQQIGQNKHNKAKRAQLQWKRSAAVALVRARPVSPQEEQKQKSPVAPAKSTGTRPRSPARESKESASKQEDVDSGAKNRASSQPSLASLGTELNESISRQDVMERIEKLAEEEKLKLLRNETLLRKRRNSLTLEKDVLEKKINKSQEKKSAVRKLLTKEDPSKVSNTIVSEARLQEVNQQLVRIEKSLEENKKQSADVLGNIKVMKSKVVRKKSSSADTSFIVSKLPSNAEERRAAFKNSPTGSEKSISSQGSLDEKFTKDNSEHFHPGLTKKVSLSSSISSATSLAALEEELRKMTPLGARRLTDSRRKKLSVSSEGSPDTKESPPITRRAFSELPKRSASGSSESSSAGRESPLPPKVNSAEIKRRRFSDSSQVAFRERSVEIDLDKSSDSRNQNAADKQAHMQGEHRASLLNALSQIKDFEEFTANVSKRD